MGMVALRRNAEEFWLSCPQFQEFGTLSISKTETTPKTAAKWLILMGEWWARQDSNL